MTDDTIRFETTVIQDAQLFKEDLYLQYCKSQYFDVDNLLSILRVYEIWKSKCIFRKNKAPLLSISDKTNSQNLSTQNLI